MATKPNDPYSVPSKMNADNTFQARPDQWGQTPTVDSPTLPHSAFDELQTWNSRCHQQQRGRRP